MYKGMLASMLGIIPYSGVELMVYSYLTVEISNHLNSRIASCNRESTRVLSPFSHVELSPVYVVKQCPIPFSSCERSCRLRECRWRVVLQQQCNTRNTTVCVIVL